MNDKWKPTDRQRQVLIKLKEASQPNESAFARDFTVYSESAWSQIMAAIDADRPRSYFDSLRTDAARNSLMEDLEDLLARLPRLKSQREKFQRQDIHPIKPFLAVKKAILQCKGKTGPERIIKVIASTGGAKSTMLQWLQEEFRGEMQVAMVECRPSWRPASSEHRFRTSVNIIQDIYGAMGMRLTKIRLREGLVAQEDALIERFNDRWTVLFIDEAENFGKYALDTIKLFLNRSGKLIVVIACTPRAHDKWNLYYPDEADQIARRTHAVISTDEIEADDVALFFAEDQFAQADQALTYIAAEASRFGHFSLVCRVREILQRSTRAARAQVEDAVARALKQMAKQRIK